jgi:sulfite oxidase
VRSVSDLEEVAVADDEVIAQSLTLPSCCSARPDWPTLVDHLTHQFAELSAEQVLCEVSAARDAVAMVGLTAHPALVTAEVIARHQLTALSRDAGQALRLVQDSGSFLSPSFTVVERQWVAEVRDMLADERDRLADVRDRVADDRDRIADRRDRSAVERDLWVRELIDTADARDREAERRDRAAERRDPASDRGQAGVDRLHAGRDRDAAAAERAAFVEWTRPDDPHRSLRG